MIEVILFGGDGFLLFFVCVKHPVKAVPLKFFISHLSSVFDPFNMTFLFCQLKSSSFI